MDDCLVTCFQISKEYLTNYLRPVRRQDNPLEFQRYFLAYSHPWKSHRFAILLGPRGMGKTTALLQFIWIELRNNLQRNTALYVPIDHFKLKKFTLYEIGEQFANFGGRLLCIDEIHKYENWAQELKSLYETFPDLTFVVSGSSVLEIGKASHDLSRRALVETVYGMSFREYLELKYMAKFFNSKIAANLSVCPLDAILGHHENNSRLIVTFLEQNDINVLAEFKSYLEEGYYPYFIEFVSHAEGKAMFWQTLEQQVHVTIESDIPNLYPSLTGVSIQKISKLLSFIAESVPYAPNYKKLKEALEIGDERTLKQYLKMLEDAQLIQVLYKNPTGFKQVEEVGKLYLQNTNLQWALSTNSNSGTLRETFLLSMLRQQGHTVYQPLEGDFLVKIDKKDVILEVGGKKKNRHQVYAQKTAYVVADDLKVGIGQKIPLWLFGFLY